MALLGMGDSGPRTGDQSKVSDSILPQTFDLVPSNPRLHFWSHPPLSLTIDGTGIHVVYGPSKVAIVRWDDPDIQFALLDYRQAKEQYPRYVFTPTLFEFRFRPPSAYKVYLPEEAFEALRAAAQAQGLDMVPGRPGRGLVAGTKVAFYGRSVKE